MNRYTIRNKKAGNIRLALWIAAVLIAVLVLLVLLGLFLKNRVTQAQENRLSAPAQLVKDAASIGILPEKASLPIRAGCLPPSNDGASPDFSSLTGLGCDAVTIEVGGTAGFYCPSALQHLLSDAVPSSSPKDLFSQGKEAGYTVSCVYHPSFPSYQGTERALYYDIDSVSLAELAAASPSEILISVTPDLTEENAALYAAVKAAAPDMLFGALLPRSVLDEEHYYATFREYYTLFDFIAIDFSDSGKNLTQDLEKASVYYSLYGARLVFPGMAIPEEETLTLLENLAITSWQTLYRIKF